MFTCLHIFNKQTKKEYVAHLWKLHHSLTWISTVSLMQIVTDLRYGVQKYVYFSTTIS